jgi:uncharacterized protein (DUF362 family)
MANIVSIMKTETLDEHGIKKAVYQALDSLDFKPTEIPRKISIKVNLCYYWDYSTGMTTDRRIVSSTIDYIRQRWNEDATINLIESDASAVRMKYAFRMLRYEELAAKKGVNLCNLSNEPSQRITVSSGNHSYVFRVPQTISSSDLFISIPKLKYHTTTLLSCALKNQFGCNPIWKKVRYHPRLNEVIVGLNKIMKPHVILVDGAIVYSDCPHKLGLVLAGTNPLSVDFIAAKIMGLNPYKVGHIDLAMKERIGEVEDIVILGEDIGSCRMKLPKQLQPSRSTRALSAFKRSLYNSYLKLVDNVPLLE